MTQRLATTYGLRLLAKPSSRYVIVAAVVLLVLCFRAAQFAVFSTQIQWGYDFSAYFAAAERVLAGLPIYSAAQLAGTYSPQQQYLYLYPPPLAIAVTPLAATFDAYRSAAWAWTALGAVIAAATALALTRSDPRVAPRDRLLYVGAAFAFPPIVGELVMGNVHLLLLGLFAVAWMSIRTGTARGEGLAGVAIGVATLVKVFPGLVVLWFLATGRWRAAGVAALTAAALFLLTLPIVGLEPWLQYPRVLANLGAPVDTTDTLAPIVWLTPVVGSWPARILVAVAGVVALLWAARRRPPVISYAVATVVSVLIAPALYHHYLAIVFLPLLLGWLERPSAWLALAYLAMWGGTQPGLGEAAWIVNRLLPTLGALLLLAALLRSSPASRGEPAEPRRI